MEPLIKRTGQCAGRYLNTSPIISKSINTDKRYVFYKTVNIRFDVNTGPWAAKSAIGTIIFAADNHAAAHRYDRHTIATAVIYVAVFD